MTYVQETRGKRPWLAALLSFVHPGLGHLYLREWVRSLLWFSLVITTALLLVPPDIVPETTSLESFTQFSQQMPMEAVLALAIVTVMSMLDAYWTASRTTGQRARDAEDDPGQRCPNCGREVDADLEFCHWCTTEIESETGDEPSRA